MCFGFFKEAISTITKISKTQKNTKMCSETFEICVENFKNMFLCVKSAKTKMAHFVQNDSKCKLPYILYIYIYCFLHHTCNFI